MYLSVVYCKRRIWVGSYLSPEAENGQKQTVVFGGI